MSWQSTLPRTLPQTNEPTRRLVHSWTLALLLRHLLTDPVHMLMPPVKMLLGPFVNDALANMGRIVSTRLLAYTGFDPRSTITFGESRTRTVYGHISKCATWKENSAEARNAEGNNLSPRNAFSLFGSPHLLNDTRAGALTNRPPQVSHGEGGDPRSAASG